MSSVCECVCEFTKVVVFCSDNGLVSVFRERASERASE